MADNTSIEWTRSDDGTPGATWNPVTGCTEISAGCDHCYAKTFAERWRGTPGHYFESGFDLQLRPDKLDQPLRWKKPRRIFVNSMSDLFHDAVPDEYIARAFAVMAQAGHHTFQLLSKRHGRMRSLLTSQDFQHVVARAVDAVTVEQGHDPKEQWAGTDLTWPLPNVWLGVSVEDQRWADIRIPALLETPAAVRWISAEPLLNPLSLHPGRWIPPVGGGPKASLNSPWGEPGPSLDWVVCGGESGSGARRLGPSWIRHLIGECQGSGVPIFVKQMGAVWAVDTVVAGKSVAGHGDRKGGNWDFWPQDLRVREFPPAAAGVINGERP